MAVQTDTLRHTDGTMIAPQPLTGQLGKRAGSGPLRLAEGAREVAELVEQNPDLWSALTTCVHDTGGRSIVHYAAAHGSPEAEQLFGPDGVLAAWRHHLDRTHESRRERESGRECVVTLAGELAGHPLTVLFTVLLGTPADTAGEGQVQS